MEYLIEKLVRKNLEAQREKLLREKHEKEKDKLRERSKSDKENTPPSSKNTQKSKAEFTKTPDSLYQNPQSPSTITLSLSPISSIPAPETGYIASDFSYGSIPSTPYSNSFYQQSAQLSNPRSQSKSQIQNRHHIPSSHLIHQLTSSSSYSSSSCSSSSSFTSATISPLSKFPPVLPREYPLSGRRSLHRPSSREHQEQKQQHSSSSGYPLCQFCETDRGLYECLDCKIIYCEEDKQRHLHAKKTQHHRMDLLSISTSEDDVFPPAVHSTNTLSSNTTTSTASYICPNHLLEYRYNCIQDSTLLCVDCFALEHCGHPCLSLMDTYKNEEKKKLTACTMS